ncbi:unnamed protein product [Rotaria socialis]
MISSSFYEYIDRETIDSDLICKICRSPFIDPIVVQCGDTYCRLCIENNMENGSHCPSHSCNQLLSIDHLTPNPPPRLVVSMLDKLKTSCSEYRIDCPGKNIGCQWFGSRNEHDEHTKTCFFEKLRPVVDILYKIIENQSLDIEKLKKQIEQQAAELGQQKTEIDQQTAQLEQQKAESIQQKAESIQQKAESIQQKIQLDQQKTKLEQQTTELGQQKTQIEQLKAQLQQQQIQISDIQSENQTQKNETASIRKQITTLDEEMNKLRSAIHQLSK